VFRISYANFYEKALFVKVDVAALVMVEPNGLCPSRYASIRCEYAIGGCGRRLGPA
jgi:hypothetical protein